MIDVQQLLHDAGFLSGLVLGSYPMVAVFAVVHVMAARLSGGWL